MAKKFNVTGEQHYGITGQMLEIQRQLRLKGGSPLDPEYVKRALQDIIQPKHDDKEENTILRLLSRGENIVIPACDGFRTIANTKEVFAYIDPNFEKHGLGKPGKATVEMLVKVYETVKNEATFVQMFCSLGVDLDKLCFTQHQIISFCESNTEWLCADDYATFFLVKLDGQFFVASVSVHSDGLFTHVRQLGNGAVFGADHPHRLVAPQLDPQKS